MKSVKVLAIAVVGLVLSAAPSQAALIGPASDIAVTATVAPEGGNFRYTFNLTNLEATALWHFIVYTPFATSGTTSTFPNWADPGLGVVPGPYDATNIDATITTLTNTWYVPFGGPNGLAAGASATFSFLGAVSMAPNFVYAYELVGTYVGSGSPEVSGIGRASAAVPEPATIALFGLGALAVARRRRSRNV